MVMLGSNFYVYTTKQTNMQSKLFKATLFVLTAIFVQKVRVINIYW